MTKIIKNILFVLIVVVLIAVLVFAVGFRFLGFQFRAVLTGSMEPDLPVGSMLIVKETPLSEIRVGDDLTYVADKNLTVVTHRVISIDEENEMITTQGIANNIRDAPVYYKNVLGVVKFSIPLLGYVVAYLSTTKGKIISITAIVVIVLLWLILGAISDKKQKQKEEKTKSKAFASMIGLGSWLSDNSFQPNEKELSESKKPNPTEMADNEPFPLSNINNGKENQKNL